MTQAANDARFMAAALAIGRQGAGRTAPNPSVGAVLVGADGVVIAAARTADAGRPHAERRALQAAGDRAIGATMYVTLEPCSHFGRTPPCADALIAAKVARVVVAVGDPNPVVAGAGIARLREAGVRVTVGVRADEAARDLAGHMMRMRQKRPSMVLKLAVSADGAIGREGGGQAAISGALSRAKAHMLRAECDGILVGVGTVLADDPALTCRLPGMEVRSPHRIVLDTHARTPPDARLFDAIAAVPVTIITGEGAPADKVEALSDAGADVWQVPCAAGGVQLEAALRRLGGTGLTRVLVEGGAKVAEAMVGADLVDEAFLIEAPLDLGGPAPVRPFGGAAHAALMRALQRQATILADGDRWTHFERQCLPGSSQTLEP
ncbi:MAG: bifunctional diaminohydroxyphosphoribosylaminopyrimidine deaminase/5-amino-6-(5-phosphoribosylamino)uracil reductase RibD [Pseudomonadota bacterium]